MSNLNPRQLAKIIDDINDLAPKIASDYEWLYSSGYQAPRNGTSRHLRIIRDDGTPPGTDERMVGLTDHIRSRISAASHAVERALTELHRAQAALNDAATAIDNSKPDASEPDPRLVERVDKGELGRARQAQARRNARAKSGPLTDARGF